MSTHADKAHKSHRKTHKAQDRPPFECIALLLQGGGALGAYQGGVYQALSQASLHPPWGGGISIGAINAALIAGNPPEARVEKLRKFWELVTMTPLWGGAGQLAMPSDLGFYSARGDVARGLVNQMSAGLALTHGVPGFFAPRLPIPW